MITQIIGIKFDDKSKTYYYNSKGIKFRVGDFAVIETPDGICLGKVFIKNHTVSSNQPNVKFKDIIRKANFKDMEKLKKDKALENKAFKICNDKIKSLNLDMKLIKVKNFFDNSKLLFTFTSEDRVDFRALVKELASIFKTRIEMKQIGVRDEAKMMGGYGECGQPLCCSRFLKNFQTVSIKMAKEQGLSLNPSKISGCCGRLMCCLKYEQDTYSELLKNSPKVGSTVKTPKGIGVVKDLNVISQTVKVQLSENQESLPSQFNIEDIEFIEN